MTDLSYPSPPDVIDAKGGTIVHGNGLEYIRGLRAESVDLILTDPPYGIDYVSNHRKGGNPFGGIVADDVPFDLLEHLEEYWRILKDGSAAYLFSRWDVSPAWIQQIQEHSKFQIKNVCVWEKNNHSMGDLEGSYGYKYEQCLFIVKGRHKLLNGRPTDIWRFDRVDPNKLRHPTEKPVDMLQFILDNSLPEDGVVIDPFAGSGSTAEAAFTQGKEFIACEIEEKYIEVIKDRLFETDERNKQIEQGTYELDFDDMFGA